MAIHSHYFKDETPQACCVFWRAVCIGELAERDVIARYPAAAGGLVPPMGTGCSSWRATRVVILMTWRNKHGYDCVCMNCIESHGDAAAVARS